MEENERGGREREKEKRNDRLDSLILQSFYYEAAVKAALKVLLV